MEKSAFSDFVSLSISNRQFVDTANAPIFGIDRDGNVNEWNNKNAEITGYTKEEAMGKPMLSFISVEFRAEVKTVLDEALRGRETSNYELEFTTKNGDDRCVYFF